MTLIHMNFRSWCLNTNTDVAVILPSIKQGESAQAYYRSQKKYPVLWLLHGTLGCYNDYLRRTNIGTVRDGKRSDRRHAFRAEQQLFQLSNVIPRFR